ncbi:hypothetical protein M0R45_020189 [Rubus argutus]|uniref:Uncharacterized protein n=1 Tax=Rubus argutus TaxID=59490 RepID=A0AAW1XAX7_RUBAR
MLQFNQTVLLLSSIPKLQLHHHTDRAFQIHQTIINSHPIGCSCIQSISITTAHPSSCAALLSPISRRDLPLSEPLLSAPASATQQPSPHNPLEHRLCLIPALPRAAAHQLRPPSRDTASPL